VTGQRHSYRKPPGTVNAEAAGLANSVEQPRPCADRHAQRAAQRPWRACRRCRLSVVTPSACRPQYPEAATPSHSTGPPHTASNTKSEVVPKDEDSDGFELGRVFLLIRVSGGGPHPARKYQPSTEAVKGPKILWPLPARPHTYPRVHEASARPEHLGSPADQALDRSRSGQ